MKFGITPCTKVTLSLQCYNGIPPHSTELTLLRSINSSAFIPALWLQSRKCLRHHRQKERIFGANTVTVYACVCVCVYARACVYNRVVYKYGCTVNCWIGAQGLARGSSRALPVANYGAFRWTSSQTVPHHNSGSCITGFGCSVSLQRRQHPMAPGRPG